MWGRAPWTLKLAGWSNPFVADEILAGE